MSVTRTEIADHVEEAFDTPPASKDDLITWATLRSARPEVLAKLAELPDVAYRSLVDLWPHLTGVPVDH